MTRLRTFLLLVLISLAATLSIQLTKKISEQALPDSAKLQGEIDYSIENFNLTLMDKTGKMQYHLNADSMLHFKESDQTQLKKPNVELFRTADEHWQIKANGGNVSARGHQVLLNGNVVIKGTSGKQKEPLLITTESLKISPKNNTISTQDEIKLSGNGITIQAKGMLADMSNETIQLLARVRGSYAPQF